MKATTILKAMVDDGAFVELGVIVLPILVAATMTLSYLIG